VFHASLLTKYKEPDEHRTNFLELPPELIRRRRRGKLNKIPLANATLAKKKFKSRKMAGLITPHDKVLTSPTSRQTNSWRYTKGDREEEERPTRRV